ncbi:MAG: hypothetical protein FWG69_00820 [Oscillospiraceae bacterium]|nr:hypothetical protein [Oscillospiraceae bacterium]
MKKIISIIMAVMLISGLLTACDVNVHPNNSVIGADGEVIEPESSGTEPSNESSNESNPKLPVIEEKVLTQIDLENEGRVNAEYVLLSGLEHDIKLQGKINEEIQTFCTWPTFNRDNDDKNITVKVEYAIIGNKYISIRAADSVYADGAAHPENNYRTATFDLETGEHAGSLIAFSNAGDELRKKITDGTFKQIFPEEPIDGAAEVLAAEFDVDNFYLTEDSLGLFVTDRPHAAGSYWIFEAKYSDITTLVGDSYFMKYVK